MTRPIFLILLFFGIPFCQAEEPKLERSSRAFEFKYGAAIDSVPAHSNVRVWFPIATSNEQQDVTFLGASKSTLRVNKDAKYGNSIGFFESKPDENGTLEFEANYKIVRREAKIQGVESRLADIQSQLFLKPNQLVPIDGKPVELVANTKLPTDSLAATRMIYDVVERHMKYDKSKIGYGRGDSVWACDNKTGNCTDFHSLFISIARSQSIPARFEIGFPIPANLTEGVVGGYHCWAWFYVSGKGWAPVDISEADKHPGMKDYYFGRLTADRVAFSTGRDIEHVPESVGGPLNYFIYPHVEVDGKLWPREKVKLNFSFKDN